MRCSVSTILNSSPASGDSLSGELAAFCPSQRPNEHFQLSGEMQNGRSLRKNNRRSGSHGVDCNFGLSVLERSWPMMDLSAEDAACAHCVQTIAFTQPVFQAFGGPRLD